MSELTDEDYQARLLAARAAVVRAQLCTMAEAQTCPHQVLFELAEAAEAQRAREEAEHE